MKQLRGHIVLISLIVALGGFLMGFDASVISGVVKFIEPEFSLTKIELGWAVSSLTLTATVAMLLAGPISDRIGRRKVLSFAAILYALSALFSAIAPSFTFLVLARMLGGFGVGASLIIAPMYIAEMAPARIRGTLVSFNQFNIVFGISAAFFTNYLILQYSQSQSVWSKVLGFDVYTWRWMLGVEAVPAIIYFLALFYVPRSPRWLLMKNREAEAISVLDRIGGNEFAREESNSIRASLSNERHRTKPKLGELFKPMFRYVLIIGIVLAILQQLTGINAVFFYAPMIFEQSGLGLDASFTQAIYVGLTNLVFTVLAMILIDRIGRKPLLMIGLSGIVISMFALAYTFSIEGAGKETNSLLILIAILAFVASFAISIGPVMWVMFSELFPNRIRAIAVSFVGFVNSVISFVVQLVFPWELESIGAGSTFLIYGICALGGLVFVLLKVPETKGKSLEELQVQLVKRNIK